MRINRFLLALATVMLFPAGAAASTTVGPELNSSQVNTNTSGLAYVPVANADGSAHMGAPSAGILTRIRIQAAGSVPTSGKATVMRQVAPWSSNQADFLKVAEVAFNVSEDSSPAGHIVEVPTRQAIQTGDVLGLDNTDASLRVFQAFADGPLNYCAYVASFPAVGDTAAFGQVGCNRSFPMIQGIIEPDADADGYGDETQDLCPSDSSRQTACLTPANIVLKAVKSTSKTASSASRSFKLTNAGQVASALVPFSIKSSKKVKNLRIVKGCKPASKKKPTSCSIASIAPGATVTIKVSLSIKAATKTTLTATSGALKATSTVKLKAKKK